MSYSLSAKGATKIDALADATMKLDAMIQQQPVHARDREAALSNLRAHLTMLSNPLPDEEVVVSMHGSICVTSDTTKADQVTSAGSGCSLYLQTRVPQ